MANFIFANYKKLLIIAGVFLVLTAVFGAKVKLLVIFPVLILVGAFSMFYHHYFRSPMNFELIKLVTVLSSVAYGIPAGLFVGFSSNILGHVFASKLDDTIFTSSIGNAIIAIVAGLLAHSSIFTAGMTAVGMNYAFIIPFIFLTGRDLGYASVWIITNVMFNTFLFSRIAPFILKLL